MAGNALWRRDPATNAREGGTDSEEAQGSPAGEQTDPTGESPSPGPAGGYGAEETKRSEVSLKKVFSVSSYLQHLIFSSYKQPPGYK